MPECPCRQPSSPLSSPTPRGRRSAMPSWRAPRKPCRVATTAWLDPGVAADLFFEAAGETRRGRGSGSRRWRAKLMRTSIVQPTATRAKRLLVADMDSTLIGQECIDELAAAIGIGAARRRDHRARDARRDRVRGRLARARRPAGRICRSPVIDEVLAQAHHAEPRRENAGRDDAGARRLCRDRLRRLHAVHRRDRAPARRRRAPRQPARRRRRPADRARSIEPILGADAKLAALTRTDSDSSASTAEQTLGVGDGANDLPMLDGAGLGVAYRAKPKVAAAADARVDHGDLTALLYAQGIRARPSLPYR